MKSKTEDLHDRYVIPADRICKPGPPLKGKPGKINCLIIGDSISIGYVFNVRGINLFTVP